MMFCMRRRYIVFVVAVVVDVLATCVYVCVCVRCVFAHSPERWTLSLSRCRRNEAPITFAAMRAASAKDNFLADERRLTNWRTHTPTYLVRNSLLAVAHQNGISVWENRSNRQHAVNFSHRTVLIVSVFFFLSSISFCFGFLFIIFECVPVSPSSAIVWVCIRVCVLVHSAHSIYLEFFVFLSLSLNEETAQIRKNEKTNVERARIQWKLNEINRKKKRRIKLSRKINWDYGFCVLHPEKTTGKKNLKK